MVEGSKVSYNTGYTRLKRALDVLFSSVLLVLCSPIMLLISLIVLFDVGWPIIFTQERPGLHGKPFRIIKFRTMTNRRGSDGELLPDEKRLTKVGALLRATSMDELPELINVVKGDMSLVGPRPLLMEYLPLYTEHQALRHQVRPGITGLAQVSGRNALTWERKFDLDVYYVEHMSFWLDVKILFLTLWKVIKAEGISAKGHATMPPFTGSQGRPSATG